MTIPVRVTPPVGQVVTTADLRAHCRLDPNSSEDDLLLIALEKSAVAMLDGYRGKLGRCILEQEWSLTYGEAGRFRLPLPDVIEVIAEDSEGESVAASLSQDSLGSVVTIDAPAVVRFKAKLPEDALDTARIAVKLLVGHWFENREAVVTGSASTSLPLTFEAVVGTISRVQL